MRLSGEVFSSLARKDQRATAGLYLRGLMLDGRRKSMQPMAERLRVDHQQLQQFVTTSPWEVVPVRKTLSRRACELIDPEAWVIDDTGFIKDGDRLAGRGPPVLRHAGQGRQLPDRGQRARGHRRGLGPLDWRLFLPESWDDRCAADPDATPRRSRPAGDGARSPTAEHHRPKWQLALEMIDELTDVGPHRRRSSVADAGYGDTTAFRQA